MSMRGAPPDPASDRRFSTGAGTALLVQALALGVVSVMISPPTTLPVTVGLAGARREMLAEVDAGMGAAVLCAVAGITLLVGGATAGSAPLSTGRRRIARWAGFSVTSSATVFLVAGLNGITDVGALVLIYAITSGVALFGILQERGHIRLGHPLLPLCFSAAIGIVPWGVIAFHQIGATVVAGGPSAIVRVITLVMLAFAVAFWLSDWRAHRRDDLAAGGRMFRVLTLLSASAFAWLVVLGSVV